MTHVYEIMVVSSSGRYSSLTIHYKIGNHSTVPIKQQMPPYSEQTINILKFKEYFHAIDIKLSNELKFYIRWWYKIQILI